LSYLIAAAKIIVNIKCNSTLLLKKRQQMSKNSTNNSFSGILKSLGIALDLYL
jgi:hypothetical protein